MTIELTEPRTDDEFAQYYRLRWERLRRPHGEALGSERDHPAEPSSVHVIARVDGQIVGAACWAVGMGRDGPGGGRHMYVRLRQIAIDHDHERQGVGAAMMQHVEAAARKLGAREMVANVRPERVAFFERFGYVVTGPGETLFDTVEHLSMVHALS